jgi:2-dehydro-3-deoxyphosphooctonate aldolase (KDO 8-P synthase)
MNFGNSRYPIIIAGPCVIENRDHAIKMADIVAEIGEKYQISIVYKASYDKANRSSIRSFRGPGLKAGLPILAEIKSKLRIPILTDIHSIEQIQPVAEVVDVVQIPAFLCRQTDLFIEAGKYHKSVNIKKGQFMAPWDMKNVVEKARESGIEDVTLTERGSCFGYNRLVVDFLSLPMMKNLGTPVIFDATHSVQLPGGGGSYTEGNRNFVPYL